MSDERPAAGPALRRLDPPTEAAASEDRLSLALGAFERLLLSQLSSRSTFMRRNTELPRVLGELLGRTADIRRLRPAQIAPWAEAELLSLETVERRHLDKVSPAYAIHNRLRGVLVEFATPEYIAVARAGEALRKDENGVAQPWPPAPEDLRKKLSDPTTTRSPELDGEELFKEIKLFHDREYENNVLHGQARRRARARLLLGLAPLLAILVAGFGLALHEAAGLASHEIVLATVAGAVGATLSGIFKVRDRLRTLGEIRAFGAQMIIQPSVGAALALFVVLALDQGLAGVTLPAGDEARAAASAAFGFVAGFSEPFALGIAQKVGDAEPAKPREGEKPKAY